jgi:hypothetical protein
MVMTAEQAAEARDAAFVAANRRRRGRAEMSNAYLHLWNYEPYIWDIPGALGDGLAELVDHVIVLHQNDLFNGICNIAYGGASGAGYVSPDPEEPEEEPYAQEQDAYRWLNEPAPRVETFLALCDELGLTPPDLVYRAAMQKVE